MSFFRATSRFMKHHAHENPTIFYSCIVGLAGPVMLVTVPPIKEWLGYKPHPPIPMSYPLPNRPRRPVTGYDDE
ncbi:DUF155 domain-containing protein [Mycena kentingensis (nom. inval.)]|nr:DUF155 domain-containing protein [Mycena kentingensis (nom. inval.)]